MTENAKAEAVRLAKEAGFDVSPEADGWNYLKFARLIALARQQPAQPPAGWEQDAKRLEEHLEACKGARIQLAKEKLALEDDAARYRHIRNGNLRFDGKRSNGDYLYGTELDAAIDAAIAAAPSPITGEKE
jgi:hypothetical protein